SASTVSVASLTSMWPLSSTVAGFGPRTRGLLATRLLGTGAVSTQIAVMRNKPPLITSFKEPGSELRPALLILAAPFTKLPQVWAAGQTFVSCDSVIFAGRIYLRNSTVPNVVDYQSRRKVYFA